jgi:glutamine synthetase
MPKPLVGESGSGLHINLSLSKDGVKDQRYEEAMTAGILRRIREITLFLNPMVNSYERLGAFEAPRYVGWGKANRSLLIRVPESSGEYRRIEVRSPDPSCNPYLAFSLLIVSALEGVKENLKMPVEDSGDANQKHTGTSLPSNLAEAMELAENSAFVRSVIPERLFTYFLEAKKADWKAYEESNDKPQESRKPFFLTT